MLDCSKEFLALFSPEFLLLFRDSEPRGLWWCVTSGAASLRLVARSGTGDWSLTGEAGGDTAAPRSPAAAPPFRLRRAGRSGSAAPEPELVLR